ncbi:immunity 49 family protein [Deinococcus altitudinis]|uniref:immunity 49 family protein n=1 Tax=Deinococcus altitudinis TaxID=468914 RepID=UPI0038911E7B
MLTLHKPDKNHLDSLEEYSREDKEEVERLLKTRAYKEDFDLFLLGDLAYDLAGRLNMSRTADPIDIYGALSLAADSYAAAFRLASYPAGEKTIDFFLLGAPGDVVRRSTGVTSKLHGKRWLTAFYLTMARHDLADLEGIVMAFPREKIEVSTTITPPFLLAQIEAYKAIYLQTADAPEKLSAFFDATSFDTIEAIDREYVLDITKFESGMIAMLMLRDEEKFNSELELALEAHKHYYNRAATAYNPDGNVRNDPQHWIYLAGMGMAAWASLLGMNVTVTSEYLPVRPIERATVSGQGG